MTALHPCPSCARHVRKHETTCPFCACALSLADLPPRPLPTQRLGRAATWAFATLVASGGACSAQSHEIDAAQPDARAHEMDGGPPDARPGCPAHPEDPACWGPDTGYGGPPLDGSFWRDDAGTDTPDADLEASLDP